MTNMVNLTILLTVITVASAAKSCQSPNVCGGGSCCRDSKHRAISLNAWKYSRYPLGPNFAQFTTHEVGTCIVGKAQKGELCDSYCLCDTGLSCWNLLNTVNPPKTCHDQAYIQAEVTKCRNNPRCTLYN